jgi:hypothetical protein
MDPRPDPARPLIVKAGSRSGIRFEHQETSQISMAGEGSYVPAKWEKGQNAFRTPSTSRVSAGKNPKKK